MTLYHVTSARNLASILRSGLQVAGSHQGRPVVWLCDRDRLLWTLGHVARWKDRDPSSMRILGVACEPDRLPCARPGIYLSWFDIPPGKIVLSALHTRIVLEPIIRYIARHLQLGDTLAGATERARGDDRFAGVSPAIFEQAARFAARLSQPTLERAVVPEAAGGAEDAQARRSPTRPCTPIARARARDSQRA
jgi:hypothetical protein